MSVNSDFKIIIIIIIIITVPCKSCTGHSVGGCITVCECGGGEGWVDFYIGKFCRFM